MSESNRDLGNVLQVQLTSRPLVNEAVQVTQTDHGVARLSVRLEDRAWTNLLRTILPISSEKNMKLDPLGSEVLSLCDGTRTVEDLIDWLQERWHLSFFEARGMILHFLRSLMKDSILVLHAPDASE